MGKTEVGKMHGKEQNEAAMAHVAGEMCFTGQGVFLSDDALAG